MGKIRFKKRPGKQNAPQKHRASSFDPEFTAYEETACARTWSEAFSHACPGSEEEEEERRRPPASRGQMQGGIGNERFLLALSVVLKHMRLPVRERDLIELEDLFGGEYEQWSPVHEMLKQARGKSSLDESEDEDEDESEDEDEDEEAEKPDLEVLCMSVGEAMGPGVGAVVLGLCSTCRGAWAMRKADRWLAAVARLAALRRNHVKCQELSDRPHTLLMFDPEAFHMAVRRRCLVLPAPTRQASALLQAVFEKHIYRLCRLALHLSMHRGRSLDAVSIGETKPRPSCPGGVMRCHPLYCLRPLPKWPGWVKRGCVLTLADVQAANFLLRTLRPASAVQLQNDYGMEGASRPAEEGEEDGRWVLEEEGMMRGLVRALRHAGVVEMQGLQVLPRLAAELGHMARAVARMLDEEGTEEEEEQQQHQQLEKQQGEGGAEKSDGGEDVALRAFVGGSDPEKTLARVLGEGKGKGDDAGGDEEEDDEGGDGLAVDVHMAAAALRSPSSLVDDVWPVVGPMQAKLGEDCQLAFTDNYDVLQEEWLAALNKQEKQGMRLHEEQYRTLDRKARLLIRFLLQQDMEALLGAAAGVVAKIRTSGYPGGGEEHERQLCFMDLCITESAAVHGDVERSWRWLRGTEWTGQIYPRDLDINKRGSEEEMRLLDYLMEDVIEHVGGKLPRKISRFDENEHEQDAVMARWLCLRARAVLQAMMGQMARHYELWAAQAEGTQDEEEEEDDDGDSDENDEDDDEEGGGDVDGSHDDDDDEESMVQEAVVGSVPQEPPQQEAVPADATQPQGKEAEVAEEEGEDDGSDEDYEGEDDEEEEDGEEEEGGEERGGGAVLTVEAVGRALRRLDRAVRAGEISSRDWWPFAWSRFLER